MLLLIGSTQGMVCCVYQNAHRMVKATIGARLEVEDGTGTTALLKQMLIYITNSVELTIPVKNTLIRIIGAIWMLRITGNTVAKFLKTLISYHLLMVITALTAVIREATPITGAIHKKAGITAPLK